MSKRRTVLAVGVLVVGLLVTSVALPTVATGKPANQVPVTYMPGEGDALAEPTSDVWADAETSEVPLASAPSGLPDAGSVSADAVDVTAARTNSDLYVRLQWRDATENRSTDSPEAFADAVAMQVPANASTHPGIALGSQSTPVNVWFWNAAEGTEEILAGGAGTITAMNDTSVQTAATHEDGTWTVVMHRSLATDSENRATFGENTDVDVAFAVWDGANAERSGHHAVSEWFTYPLGPTESGPSYQYLLWGLAGLAVVVALVVTITAIRGTE